MIRLHSISIFFFFNDTATTEIYTLSLHDALPISRGSDDDHRRRGVRPRERRAFPARGPAVRADRVPHDELRQLRPARLDRPETDRKSIRLNSSHLVISYAVFCLKKKKQHILNRIQ